MWITLLGELIAKLIFLYTYDRVKTVGKQIKREQRAQGVSASLIRQMCNVYGIGFYRGLKQAYKEQAHKEWALALTTPQPVLDAMKDCQSTRSTYNQSVTQITRPFLLEGITEGKKFFPCFPSNKCRKLLIPCIRSQQLF